MEVDEVDLVKDITKSPAAKPKNKQGANKAVPKATSILQGLELVDEGVLSAPLPEEGFAKQVQEWVNSALAGVTPDLDPHKASLLRKAAAFLLQCGLQREMFKRAEKASTRTANLTKQVANQAPGFEQSPTKLRDVPGLLNKAMDGADEVRKDLSDLFGVARSSLLSTEGPSSSGGDTGLADLLLQFYNSGSGGMFQPKKKKGDMGKSIAAALNHTTQKHLQMVHAAAATGNYKLATQLLLSMRNWDKEVRQLSSVSQVAGADMANSLYLSRNAMHGISDAQWNLIAELADNKDFKEVFRKVTLPEPNAKRPRPAVADDGASDSSSDDDGEPTSKKARKHSSTCTFCGKKGHRAVKCFALTNMIKGVANNGGGSSGNKQQKQKPSSS